MSKTFEFATKDILSRVTPTPMIDNGLSDNEKILKLTELFKDVLETLGMDLTNGSLQESPARIARMYVNEVFKGLNSDNFPKLTAIENEMSYDQMLVVRDVSIDAHALAA